MASNDGQVVATVTQPTTTYQDKGLQLLTKDFPHLSVQCITLTFRAFQIDFTRTFRALENIRDIVGNTQTLESHARLCKEYSFLRHTSEVTIQEGRPNAEFRVTDTTLLAEVQGMDEFTEGTREVPKANGRGGNAQENVGQEVATSNVLFECECCFGDVSIDEMVQCTQAHLFCLQCLENHANEELYGKNAIEFKCMDSSGLGPCEGVFNRDQLNKLPPGFRWNYDMKVTRIELQRAGIVECPCPSCGYIGFSDDNVTMVQCVQCHVEYCKNCKESTKMHTNKTCEEVQLEKTRQQEN